VGVLLHGVRAADACMDESEGARIVGEHGNVAMF
jgi:hypothetical protein